MDVIYGSPLTSLPQPQVPTAQSVAEAQKYPLPRPSLPRPCRTCDCSDREGDVQRVSGTSLQRPSSSSLHRLCKGQKRPSLTAKVGYITPFSSSASELLAFLLVSCSDAEVRLLSEASVRERVEARGRERRRRRDKKALLTGRGLSFFPSTQRHSADI